MGSNAEPPRATTAKRPARSARRFERRIWLLAVAAGTPGSLTALVFLWRANLAPETRWLLAGLLVITWIGAVRALHRAVVRPLQSVANVVAAIHEGDFSIRGRGDAGGDALALTFAEINRLAETLQAKRFTALEATALLRAVMEEIETAVFVFDEARRLRFVNRSGERLLGQAAPRLIGSTAEAVGLADCLAGEPERSFDAPFPGGTGKWQVRRSTFRQDGRPHRLIVLSDLSRVLRDEERLAWQRLIRVLGHEINNSLAPIKSIAGSLRDLVNRPSPPDDWRDDLRSGLAVIESRSESLTRLMAAYALLARLPKPVPTPIDVEQWLRRVARLETRLRVNVAAGPRVTVDADADQLDLLAINLVRNAADAALETNGGVRIGWKVEDAVLEVSVEDEGLGILNTANLFVPFFTTKPSGSGIGLTLSRQIAEAHGGTLLLANREGGRGSVATLRLPRRLDAAPAAN